MSSSVALLIATATFAAEAVTRRSQFERPLASCDEPEFVQMLENETSMMPTVGQVVVDIPFEILRDLFRQPALWPTWNHFVSNTQTKSFELCEPFHSDFLDFAVPFTRDYEPAGHQTIVKLEDTPDLFQVAWKYHIVDNEGETAIFGKHSTSVYRFDGSADRSAFYTWEKATGYEPRYAPEAFLMTFGAVVDRSMDGIKCLESVYGNTGSLEPATVEAACGSEGKDEAEPTKGIVGHVRDATTGQGVGGVDVTLACPEGARCGPGSPKKTQANGHTPRLDGDDLSTEDLAAGVYTMSFATRDHFGGDGFFGDAVVKFTVTESEQQLKFTIPITLSEFGYSVSAVISDETTAEGVLLVNSVETIGEV